MSLGKYHLAPVNLFNLSVWDSLEQLQAYVYSSTHAQIMRQRRHWFEKFAGMYLALWWVEAGHVPTVTEIKQRIDRLNEYGESKWAFSFKLLSTESRIAVCSTSFQSLSCKLGFWKKFNPRWTRMNSRFAVLTFNF